VLNRQIGGFGSGCRKSYFENTVEDCRVLDASHWMRQGILRQDFTRSGTLLWVEADTGEVKSSIRYEADTCGLDAVRLIYTIAATGEQMNYAICLQTTIPHHGSLRWWFTCPLIVNGKRCERRVQKLYLPPRGRQSEDPVGHYCGSKVHDLNELLA
jgi:hypothetical protein